MMMTRRVKTEARVRAPQAKERIPRTKIAMKELKSLLMTHNLSHKQWMRAKKECNQHSILLIGKRLRAKCNQQLLYSKPKSQRCRELCNPPNG